MGIELFKFIMHMYGQKEYVKMIFSFATDEYNFKSIIKREF